VRRITCYVLAMFTVSAGVARAQIIRPQFNRSPAAYVSLGLGWLNQQGFCDKNAGGDCYDFGQAPQWRASFEMPLGGGSAWGVVGTLSRVSLTYYGTGLLNSCGQCDANANISQILGLFKMSGGQGFHQVIDIAAGAAMFNNFRASTGGTRLGSGKATTRLMGSIAYGFGYGFSPRSEAFVEEEYGMVFLPRTTGNNNNTANIQTLRIGARFGLGDKR